MAKPGPILKPNGEKVLDVHPLRTRSDEVQQRARSLALAKYHRRWELLPFAIALIQELAGCDELTAFELWKIFVVRGQVHIRGPEEIAIGADEIESAMARRDGIFMPSSGVFLPWIKTDLDELRTALVRGPTTSKQGAPTVPARRGGAKKAMVAQAIAELWPQGIPEPSIGKERNNRIREHCKTLYGTTASDQTIRRVLAAQRRAHE